MAFTSQDNALPRLMAGANPYAMVLVCAMTVSSQGENVLDYLIRHTTALGDENEDGATPMDFAVCHYRSFTACKTLLRHGHRADCEILVSVLRDPDSSPFTAEQCAELGAIRPTSKILSTIRTESPRRLYLLLQEGYSLRPEAPDIRNITYPPLVDLVRDSLAVWSPASHYCRPAAFKRALEGGVLLWFLENTPRLPPEIKCRILDSLSLLYAQ